MPKIRLKLFGTVTLTWALFTTWVGNKTQLGCEIRPIWALFHNPVGNKAQISVTGPNSVSQLCDKI